MKKILSLLLLIFLLPIAAKAEVEQRRQKNTATRYVISIRNATTGNPITGAAGLDTECVGWADGSNPGSPADVSNEATELGSTGFYYVQLTAGETNYDYIICQTKSSTTNAITAGVLINTKHGTILTNASGQLADSTISETTFAPTNTFQTGSSTSNLILAAGETSNDLTGQSICIGSGTAFKDCALITAYNTSTKAATVSPILTNAPASGDSYSIGDTKYALVSDKTGFSLSSSQTFNTTGTVGGVTGNVSGNVGGSCATVTGAVTCGSVSDKTNYALSSASLTAVENQIWNAVRASHVTAGTFGAGVVVSSNTDKTGYSISGTKTTLDALNDVSTANVNTQCTAALNTYDAPTNTEMVAAFTAIKGATWNSSTDTLEAIRDNSGGGGGGGDCANVGEIADAVWDELLTDHTITGSAGKILTLATTNTLTCNVTR